MSSSPSSRRHGDWASLPRDIVLDIFHRLGPREVMLGAEFACKRWRSVALEEPSLWRRVCIETGPSDDKHPRWRATGVEQAMNLVAVDRAAGQCEAFEGCYVDDEYLLNLVERAPSLKCLRISGIENNSQSGEDLVEALMKLPVLEELEVYFKYTLQNRDLHSLKDKAEDILRSICQVCPHLKKLVLIFASAAFDLEFVEVEYSMQPIDGEIPMMPKLQTLELYDCDLYVEGLKSILDHCPVLETLHIDGYFNKDDMDKELRLKCARVKNLTLPTRISADNGPEHEYYYFDTDLENCDSQEDYDSVEEDEYLLLREYAGHRLSFQLRGPYDSSYIYI